MNFSASPFFSDSAVFPFDSKSFSTEIGPLANNSLSTTAPLRRNYVKFSPELLSVMTSAYEQNPYPAKFQLISMGQRFKENHIRIRNWFRSQRKRDLEEGKLSHQKKNFFNEKEQSILKSEFTKENLPSQQKCLELAKKLHRQPKNIKNWFEYQRKILRRTKNQITRKEEPLNQTKPPEKQQQSPIPQNLGFRMAYLYVPVGGMNNGPVFFRYL